MATPTSEISLAALARGEQIVWADAYPILYKEIWVVLSARLRPGLGVDAEDLIVEIVTEEIMPGLKELRTDSFKALRGFDDLLRLARAIASRRAVDVIRRVLRKKEECLPEDWERVLGTTEAGSDPGDEEFFRLVAWLKPPKPELFADHFIGGLSYPEIAAKRGMALGTVCCHFKRGLDELRRLMSTEPVVLKGDAQP